MGHISSKVFHRSHRYDQHGDSYRNAHFASFFLESVLNALPKSLYVRKSCFEPLVDSSGVYICNSIVNYLRHGNYICKSEEKDLSNRRRLSLITERLASHSLEE